VKQHFSEADLLETYYTQPGQSMPVMMHLADCSECAARYERLERKVRGLAACEHEKPETFWSRQRIAIMRKIDARRGTSFARVARVAAAAMLVLILGAVIATRLDEPAAPPTVTAELSVDDATLPLDDSPWASEELDEFHSMVAWESWVENGDQSL
jgi:predicted anti-sigma-YlaC factor YlaD